MEVALWNPQKSTGEKTLSLTSPECWVFTHVGGRGYRAAVGDHETNCQEVAPRRLCYPQN